jgi:choline dehydrogenase
VRAPSDYDEWGHGWSYDTIKPYLERAVRELRVRQLTREELSPWHGAFAAAAGDDAILHPVNAIGTVRWNAAFAYLDVARGRDNLTIIADTLVDRVLLADDRAVGVATAKGELRAGTVVLAAGAYGSPGILLRSGIAPVGGLPVGEGLCDHVGVGFGFEGTQRLQRETADFERSHPLFMAQVTVAIASSVCPEGLCDLVFFPGIDPPAPSGYEASVAVFAIKPASRGSVRLASRDPRAPLVIDHGFLSDAHDAEVLAEGVETLRRLATPFAPTAVARRAPVRRSTRSRTYARRPAASSPGRDLRDRPSRGWWRPRLRDRRTLCRGCLNHADDSAGQHQPVDPRAGRATSGEHPPG